MKDSRLFLWLVVVFAIGWLLFKLSPILTPFLMAALIAYLGDPLADRLEARKIPRAMAVTIVFASFFIGIALIILVLIPTLDSQVSRLAQNVPDYFSWAREQIGPMMEKYLSIDPATFNLEGVQKALKENLGDTSSFLKKLIAGLAKPANFIVTWGTYLFLIPVVAFYLLRDWDILLAKINDLIPRSKQDMVKELASRCDYVLGGFLRGQVLVMLALGVLYAVGLSVLGLDLAIIIGLFAGLVSFVPYLGLIVGILIAGLMAIIQFQDWVHPLGVVIIFTLAQMIEGTILTPKFVGERTGLHPVAVLFSVLAGGQLFGFLGILLALPIAAMINVFLGYFKEHYLQSELYNDEESAIMDDSTINTSDQPDTHHDEA
ncbi:AI-2E family transporter [Suttonella sp. R2A3]|uniref:AI-2E family transporter n=1 Tax=Suttonella sp. R2A3 TaxID=2908648 RepID=UPI001F33072A|nr:AI-2E family transporter [Suttonella sp. R2A3]UJF23719.1 AI-2E family transporter [Suttonella sp. R2A3]